MLSFQQARNKLNELRRSVPGTDIDELLSFIEDQEERVVKTKLTMGKLNSIKDIVDYLEPYENLSIGRWEGNEDQVKITVMYFNRLRMTMVKRHEAILPNDYHMSKAKILEVIAWARKKFKE